MALLLAHDYKHGFLIGHLHNEFRKIPGDNLPVLLKSDYKPYNKNFYYQALKDGSKLKNNDFYYVFASLWQNESCFENGNINEQCKKLNNYYKNNFTIHGLWPNFKNSSSSYDGYCTNEPFDIEVIKKIGIDKMNTYWPSTDGPNEEFWKHEWEKHGTCSGLSQIDYFNTILNLHSSLPTPEFIKKNKGNEVKTKELENLLKNEKNSIVTCSDNKLSGYRICYEQLDGIPTKQILCPPRVIEEGCKIENILIPPKL